MTDAEARSIINTEIYKNIFVKAGAGSGKTTSLVSRLVNMVENNIKVEEICAITFTKAAANEFYERFQKELKKSSSEKAKEALKNIDLCFMGTIDSFCQMIISGHPTLAGVPYNSSVKDNKTYENNIREVLIEIKKGLHGKAIQDKWKAFRKEFYNAEDIAIWNMREFLSLSHLKIEEISSEEISKEDIDYVKKFIEVLGTVDIENQGLRKGSNATWRMFNENKVVWNLNIETASITKVKEILDELKGKKCYDQLGVRNENPDECFYEQYGKKYRLKQEVQSKLSEISSNCGKYLFKIAYDFILESSKIIGPKLKEKGILRFDDYLDCLRNMLKNDIHNDRQLINQITEKHKYFLIDEFQDTNPIQAEIFFYLASESIENKEDWRTCKLRPGSLFIVGDPKQSIYRFRNADLKSYKRVEELFYKDNCAVVDLTRNFRSNCELCKWFNDKFKSLFPIAGESEDVGIFSPIPVEDNVIDNKKLLKGAYCYSLDKSDFLKVSEIIFNLVGKFDINDKDAGPRKIKYSDIMVITKAKTNIKKYMKAFRDLSIPFIVEGAVPFNECPALEALQRIVAAIADPSNKKDIFSATKLTKCKVTTELLKKYDNNENALSLITKLIDDLDLIKNEGDSNVEYLYYALELLNKAEIKDLMDAASFLKSLIEEDDDTQFDKIERSLMLQNKDAIKIANLHKVKGLEKPVVILSKWGQDSSDRSLFYVNYGEKKAYPLRVIKGKRDNTPNDYQESFSKFSEESEKANECENVRLKYVAATRARELLIIENSWAGINPSANIFEVFKDGQDFSVVNNTCDNDFAFASTEKNNILSNIGKCKKLSYATKKPSDLDSDKKNVDLEDRDVLVRLKEGNDAALKGTMVHRLMEVIASSSNVESKDIDFIVKNILKENGIDQQDIAKYETYVNMLKDIAKIMMDNGGYPQVNGVERDILATLKNAKDVLSEVPFYYCIDEKLINGVIDLIYQDQDGWHIIDWKTNADNADLDSHYKSQLDLYSEAFEKISGEAVKDAKIYHIDILTK